MPSPPTCCMVCLHSHNSPGRWYNPNCSILALDRPTCIRSRFDAVRVIQELSAPAWGCYQHGNWSRRQRNQVGGEISGRVGEIFWTRRRNILDASAQYFGRVGEIATINTSVHVHAGVERVKSLLLLLSWC